MYNLLLTLLASLMKAFATKEGIDAYKILVVILLIIILILIGEHYEIPWKNESQKIKETIQ